MLLNKKKLELILQKCEGYANPKVELEQYVTPSHIAAELLFVAFLKGDIKGKIVADLGCGTGILGIGAKIMGAKKVLGIDIDKEAIEIAKENAKKMEVKIDFIVGDIENFNVEVDTVLQNPPFGVKRRGADLMFLKKSIQISKVVYSMHKRGTREFIINFLENSGAKITDMVTVSFPLPRLYTFHQKDRKFILVDLYRIET